MLNLKSTTMHVDYELLDTIEGVSGDIKRDMASLEGVRLTSSISNKTITYRKEDVLYKVKCAINFKNTSVDGIIEIGNNFTLFRSVRSLFLASSNTRRVYYYLLVKDEQYELENARLIFNKINVLCLRSGFIKSDFVTFISSNNKTMEYFKSCIDINEYVKESVKMNNFIYNRIYTDNYNTNLINRRINISPQYIGGISDFKFNIVDLNKSCEKLIVNDGSDVDNLYRFMSLNRSLFPETTVSGNKRNIINFNKTNNGLLIFSFINNKISVMCNCNTNMSIIETDISNAYTKEEIEQMVFTQFNVKRIEESDNIYIRSSEELKCTCYSESTIDSMVQREQQTLLKRVFDYDNVGYYRVDRQSVRIKSKNKLMKFENFENSESVYVGDLYIVQNIGDLRNYAIVSIKSERPSNYDHKIYFCCSNNDLRMVLSLKNLYISEQIEILLSVCDIFKHFKEGI